MHYYNFHIKDYHAATSHLSIEEDCCYRRLLDYYYEQESGIHSDDVEYVARRIRIHPETVQQILDEFFTLLDGVYFSRRADTEIEAYHKKSEGGKKGAASRWAEGKSKDSHGIAIANPLPTQSVPNAKPMLTINQEPLTNNHKETSSVSHEKIVFDGSKFQNINGQLEVWKSAYPAISVEAELAKAAAWIVANPKNVKKQWGRFLNGWLSRAQDKAPRVEVRRQSGIV